GEAGELRAELDAALSRVDKLTIEMERLRGELSEAWVQARVAGEQRDTEYQQLRRRVSEQGARLRAATDAQAAAERTADELRVAAER
ncbi:RNA-binding protein, partial [Pseudonocardia aurantiaca]